jgi:uncharacterized FlaG/YvyC family protein
MFSKKPPQFILDLARKLDTPEMRALYRSQKKSNPGLDQSVEELSEQLDDIFEHLKDSLNDGKT